ncbi:hypothetical protein BGW38_003782 [Lunasporangiospora selenospora]|uniref:DNA replication checkpoint mediator MRC1 domain-containing protein n=1 Tax=Lunasporangiospora selenospora TaxID=979761 RepID=A0A9P6G2H0_9FUNG|nr:hypothetical protein BGW38_003782 [Lunasporangiospora selenospora]
MDTSIDPSQSSPTSHSSRESSSRESSPSEDEAPSTRSLLSSRLLDGSDLPRASTSTLFSSNRGHPDSSPEPSSGHSKPLKQRDDRRDQGSFLFSPGLSPRKPKKTKSFQDSRQKGTGRPKSPKYPHTTPPQLTSPESTFVLKRRPIEFSDSDSDVSSMDEDMNFKNVAGGSPSRRVSGMTSLKPSHSSKNKGVHADKSRKKALGTGAKNKSQAGVDRNLFSQDDEHELVEGLFNSDQSSSNANPQEYRPPTANELLQLQQQREALVRSTGFTLKQRAHDRSKFSSIMDDYQSNLVEKNSSPVQILKPQIPQKPKSHGVRTISLDDDSEDELEEDDIKKQEEAQWRLSASKAVLSAPKEKQRELTQRLLSRQAFSSAGGLEIGNSSPMSPLSKKIHDMSIGLTQQQPSSSPQTESSQKKTSHASPSKSQSALYFRDFNAAIRRKAAKRNLNHRMGENGISGNIQQGQNEDGILEQDGNSEGEMADEDSQSYQGDQEAEAGSADDEAFSGDSESDQDEAEGDDEAEGEVEDKVEDESMEEDGSQSSESESEESEDSSEELEEDNKIGTRAKSNRKRILMDDEDDVSVTLPGDHDSLVPQTNMTDILSEELEESTGASVAEKGSNGGSVTQSGPSPGFGAFFEASGAFTSDARPLTTDTMGSSSGPSDTKASGKNSQNPFNSALSSLLLDPAHEHDLGGEGHDRSDGEKNATGVSVNDTMLGADGATGPRRRQLVKREAKPKFNKNLKSDFIDYEAEEEEDEYMGMGGVDYESDNDNDDYDLGDGMIDASHDLDSKDVENVRQLHMEHEQVRHNKEIMDLVHGIASGNLWKRRHGQGDDLDIYDEDDIGGGFQRKKKLKVLEKFERLGNSKPLCFFLPLHGSTADKENTAAFARAFEKNVGDDQLVFLNDPYESDDGSGLPAKEERPKSDMAQLESDEDEEIEGLDTSTNTPESILLDGADGAKPLDTTMSDVRPHANSSRSSVKTVQTETTYSILAKTKAQVLPFANTAVSASMDFAGLDMSSVIEDDEELSDSEDMRASTRLQKTVEDPVVEYRELMRRTMVIRGILDGEGGGSPSKKALRDRRASQEHFELEQSFDSSSILGRVVDSRSSIDYQQSTSSHATFTRGHDGDSAPLPRPPTLTRQSSSFLSDERRKVFLNTVGEDNRSAGSRSRVNKEGTRRMMAFGAPAGKGGNTEADTSSSKRAASSSSASSSSFTTPSAPSLASKRRPKGDREQGGTGSGQLLQVVSNSL